MAHVGQADSPRSWLVCFASFITLTLNNGSYYSFGLFMSSLLKHFGQSISTTGNVLFCGFNVLFFGFN